MKIALVSEHASPLAVLGGVDAGGQNVYVAELARALASRDHEISVFTRRDDTALERIVRLTDRIAVVHVDAGPAVEIPKDRLLPYMTAFGEELARFWQADLPDVAHSHFWMSGIATRLAARKLGIPWAHTYHALGAEKRREQGAADASPFSRVTLERSLLRDADIVIATSTAEVTEHRRTRGACEIARIPCGVLPDAFEPAQEPLGGERGAGCVARPRIVTLSRLVPRKGVGDVIRALAEIPDAELTVGGGGEGAGRGSDSEAVRLRALSMDAGVADRVRFSGPIARAEVARFLRSADVVVCAPRYEPFGIVPLEAMACARPVVATHVGGLVDTVIDGETGIHVPPGDPSAIATAVRRLLADPELRVRLGTAGLRRARAHFTWERVAQSMETAYAGIIARRGGVRETIA